METPTVYDNRFADRALVSACPVCPTPRPWYAYSPCRTNSATPLAVYYGLVCLAVSGRSEKKFRCPSWCDRVLYSVGMYGGDSVRRLALDRYWSSGPLLSDHTPGELN